MLGVPPRFPSISHPPQLAWPAHQWTEPLVPASPAVTSLQMPRQAWGREAALLESCDPRQWPHLSVLSSKEPTPGASQA